MEPLRSDPSLYVVMTDGVRKGLSRGCVGDLPKASDSSFRTTCDNTRKKFDMAEDGILPCMFLPISLSTDRDSLVMQDPHKYLSNPWGTTKGLLFSGNSIDKSAAGLAGRH